MEIDYNKLENNDYLNYCIFMNAKTPTQKFLASKLYTAHSAIRLKDRDNYIFLIKNQKKLDDLFIHDCFLLACSYDFLECVDYILKRYQIPDLVYGFEFTFKESPHVFNYLLENYDFPLDNKILTAAVENANDEIFKILVEYGMDVYTDNKALFLAIENKRLNIIRILINDYKINPFSIGIYCFLYITPYEIASNKIKNFINLLL